MKGNAPDRIGVYRLLARLEEQEIVSHAWSESDEGPAKRLYELTPSGQKCLVRWIETLDEYKKEVHPTSAYLLLWIARILSLKISMSRKP